MTPCNRIGPKVRVGYPEPPIEITVESPQRVFFKVKGSSEIFDLSREDFDFYRRWVPKGASNVK